MPVHYYIAPVIGSGTRQDPYRLKVADYVPGQVSGPAVYWWQTDTNGLPATSWGLSAVRGSTFTAIDNDATIDDLLGGSVPAQIDSADQMISFLQANTLGSLSTARKNRIFAVLDKYAVQRADFTNASLLWDVLYRVFQTIFGFQGDMTPVLTGFFV